MSIEHERIKAIRKAAGIKTQEEFAERVGVSTETISKIEQGKNAVSLSVAKSVAEKFGTTLDYIYGLTDDTNDDAATMLLYLKKLFNHHVDSKYSKKCSHVITVRKCVGEFLDKYAEAIDALDRGMPKEALDLWIEKLKADFNFAMAEDDDTEVVEYHLLHSEYADDYILTVETRGADIAHPPIEWARAMRSSAT